MIDRVPTVTFSEVDVLELYAYGSGDESTDEENGEVARRREMCNSDVVNTHTVVQAVNDALSALNFPVQLQGLQELARSAKS